MLFLLLENTLLKSQSDTFFLLFFFFPYIEDPLNRMKKALAFSVQMNFTFQLQNPGNTEEVASAKQLPKIGPLPFTEGGNRGLWGIEYLQELWAVLNLFFQIHLRLQEESGLYFYLLHQVTHPYYTVLGISAIYIVLLHKRELHNVINVFYLVRNGTVQLQMNHFYVTGPKQMRKMLSSTHYV